MQTTMTSEQLRAAWLDKKNANVRARARDAARELRVSEAELVAAFCGSGATRLRNAWASILPAMPSVGKVMCLTRNEHCVIERDGTFLDVSVGDRGGQVLGPDIDLRMFFHAWRHAFELVEQTPSGERRSIQIFDGQGVAVHKIYARPTTDITEWRVLVEQHAHDDQSTHVVHEPRLVMKAAIADEDVNIDAFRAAWLGLRDTHDFFGLLGAHGVTRTQALRLAPVGMTQQVPVTAARFVLTKAAAAGLPIMIFVGNRGCIQIHTGPVSRIVPAGPWLNVLDPAHNLHLREDAIHEAWVVRKPTRDGIVTSVEIFDANGEVIALFFGERKPGRPELEPWRSLVAQLSLVEPRPSLR